MMANLGDLHNLGLREQSLADFDDTCRALMRRSMQIGNIQAGVGLWINVVGILLLAGLVGGGLWLGVSSASVLTSFAAMGMLLEPLSELVRARSSMHTKLARLGDLFQLIDRLRERQQEIGQEPLHGSLESLRFEKVSYRPHMTPFLWSPRRYRKQATELQEGDPAVVGEVIIREVSFEARRGEILGIIGRSGAGKSTLAHLALRLLDPTAGRILANDQDTAHLNLATYWKQASLVTQLTFQVEGSIAEEVRLVHPRAKEEELCRALDEAGIDATLRAANLDSDDLEDDGSQAAWHTRSLRQRTEWARLWLRPTRLVVLDEPTSLVDAAQEQRFVQSLLRHKKDWITLLISHRATTLAACDRLLVMEAGRIVAEGPRSEILPRWLPALLSEGALAS
jgi:ABC-type multidrug transport system fused ATPase/permease subunit